MTDGSAAVLFLSALILGWLLIRKGRMEKKKATVAAGIAALGVGLLAAAYLVAASLGGADA